MSSLVQELCFNSNQGKPRKPMKLLLINPNTSSAMTAAIAKGAQAVALSSTEIVATQPSFGPLSIEGHYDEAFAAAGVAEQVKLAATWGPMLSF